MKERPILFSAAMVLALRGNRKTVTRRTRGLDHVNSEPDNWIVEPSAEGWNFIAVDGPASGVIRCPYGVPGDRLWTRETLKRPDGDPWLYAADKEPVMVSVEHETEMLVWAHHKQQDHCVSIHMPRWASRDTLEVVSARPERLQAITEEDCYAEGCTDNDRPDLPYISAFGGSRIVNTYAALWKDINGPDSWKKNPWVWRIEYRRLSATQEPGESA